MVMRTRIRLKETSVRLPNFFILGAPKCGTYAFREYLRHHPNVFFSARKELNFLDSDLPQEDETGFFVISDLDEYLEHFAGADERHLAVGEGSVHYLRSGVAVRNILDLNPDARLIAMVRNPVELVHAFHRTRVVDGRENILDFEKAWRKQDERRQGRSIPKFCVDKTMLLYSEIGMLGGQLERVFGVAPTEQVKVVILDDFVENPRETYEGVLNFLNLPSDGRKEFPKINTSKRARSRLFGRGLGYVSRKTLRTKKALGIRGGLGVIEWLEKRNTIHRPRPPLSASFEAELRDHFREDIELLSQLLGRDLSPWLRGESVAENASKRTQ
jgi:hypothetical protein